MLTQFLKNRFPEFFELRSAIKRLRDNASVEILTEIPCGNHRFPIQAVSLNFSNRADAPTLLIVGGVHGLERIGSQVATGFLNSLSNYLPWDRITLKLLEEVRLVFIPILNPSGVFLNRRSNANGVDLMRNSPIDAEPGKWWQIYRGHRISNHLPWFRGKASQGFEPEAQALVDFVKTHLFQSRLIVSLDIHSGFGAVDRLWCPYAKSQAPFYHLPEVYRLRTLLNRTHPNHVYQMEPQSLQYTTHGDLWDYLYDLYREAQPNGVFLPLTLEMGSWNWLKKNPLQILRPLGLFHPIKVHRIRRTLRRHRTLFEFLTRAVASPEAWSISTEQREPTLKEARQFWKV